MGFWRLVCCEEVIGGSWRRTSREQVRLAHLAGDAALLFYAILHDITTISREEDWNENLPLTTVRISLAAIHLFLT